MDIYLAKALLLRAYRPNLAVRGGFTRLTSIVENRMRRRRIREETQYETHLLETDAMHVEAPGRVSRRGAVLIRQGGSLY